MVDPLIWTPLNDPQPQEGTEGWARMILHNGYGVSHRCTARVHRKPPVNRRQCKKTASYAVWDASTLTWQTPLCAIHYEHRNAG